jgi:predicted MPP superfamily phosphohydrolase
MRFFFDSGALEYDRVGGERDHRSSPHDNSLDGRLGHAQARRRRLSEMRNEARIRPSVKRFDLTELASSQSLISATLIASGLYRRGLRNAACVEVRRNHIALSRLPKSFDGFTLLHLSDLHADMSQMAMRRVASLVAPLQYDVCVFTGDFRGQTFGPFDEALEVLAPITGALRGPLYGVLGNHDPVAMVPCLEALGIRMLLNECVAIERGGERIHLAGIDDAHFYESGSIERAAAGVPRDNFAILLSHTPEVYREAERSGFDVMLSGHTHGGQICLPGGIPITLEAKLPRHMGKGAWRYGKLRGYTSVGAGSSVVPVRFNCPPEITLHHFEARR